MVSVGLWSGEMDEEINGWRRGSKTTDEGR